MATTTRTITVPSRTPALTYNPITFDLELCFSCEGYVYFNFLKM